MSKVPAIITIHFGGVEDTTKHVLMMGFLSMYLL